MSDREVEAQHPRVAHEADGSAGSSAMLRHHHFSQASGSSVGPASTASGGSAGPPLLSMHHHIAASAAAASSTASPASRSNAQSETASARSLPSQQSNGGAAAVPSRQPLLGAHHRFNVPASEAQSPPPRSADQIFGGADPATDDEINWQALGAILNNGSQGIPIPGEMRGYYANTSSESEFQYGEEDVQGQVRRAFDRQALKSCEEASKRRMQMMSNLDKLIKVLPHSEDNRTEAILNNACGYINKLSDSAHSAQSDNIKLGVRIEEYNKAKAKAQAAAKPVAKSTRHLIPPETPPMVHLKRMQAAVMRAVTPSLLIFAFLFSTAVSPRRLLLWARISIPQLIRAVGARMEALVACLPDVHLFSFETNGPAGMDLAAVWKGCLVTLLIRRMTSLAEQLLILLDAGSVPEQPAPGPAVAAAAALPAVDATPSRCASMSSSRHGGGSMSSSAPYTHTGDDARHKVPLKTRAKSNVVAYLHSEGIETRGRVVEGFPQQHKEHRQRGESSSGGSASAKHRRRSVGACSTSSIPAGRAHRTASTASQRLMRMVATAYDESD
eukprot:TRINITY_DN30479_c0_g1_i1.p1 TRINITY_DN30479_c0_g1~~TRINITY_DN30479_c0_g1_i1.p1  ORF type:complete len:557 (+),score=167.41 TRINITY_DN30479_c0_g1_i1:126-1796(+)